MINQVSASKRKNVCKNIYEYIKYFCQQVDMFKEFSDLLKIDIPETSYTNFRDALFHFIKLYSVEDETELACQMFAVQEHLGRALTDIDVLFLKIASSIAEAFVNDRTNNEESIDVMRIFMHKMRMAIVVKRTKGMMINDNIPLDNENLLTLDILSEYTKYIYDNNLIQNYYGYIKKQDEFKQNH